VRVGVHVRRGQVIFKGFFAGLDGNGHLRVELDDCDEVVVAPARVRLMPREWRQPDAYLTALDNFTTTQSLHYRFAILIEKQEVDHLQRLIRRGRMRVNENLLALSRRSPPLNYAGESWPDSTRHIPFPASQHPVMPRVYRRDARVVRTRTCTYPFPTRQSTRAPHGSSRCSSRRAQT
jgi:hypothetical protein